MQRVKGMQQSQQLDVLRRLWRFYSRYVFTFMIQLNNRVQCKCLCRIFLHHSLGQPEVKRLEMKYSMRMRWIKEIMRRFATFTGHRTASLPWIMEWYTIFELNVKNLLITILNNMQNTNKCKRVYIVRWRQKCHLVCVCLIIVH